MIRRRKGPNVNAGARSGVVKRQSGPPEAPPITREVRRDAGVLVVLLPDEMEALRGYWDAKARGVRLFGRSH